MTTDNLAPELNTAIASECPGACPVRRTAELIEGKWTTLIIRDLIGGKKRYSELQRSPERDQPAPARRPPAPTRTARAGDAHAIPDRAADHRVRADRARAGIARRDRGNGQVRPAPGRAGCGRRQQWRGEGTVTGLSVATGGGASLAWLPLLIGRAVPVGGAGATATVNPAKRPNLLNRLAAQPDGEAGALAGRAICGEAAAVAFDQGLADPQAEAVAARLLGGEERAGTGGRGPWPGCRGRCR